jgi:hypothetical protein
VKIRNDHYATLRDAIADVIAAHPDAIDTYRRAGLSDKRFRWDCLHAARIEGKPSYVFICTELYQYLDDRHIDTALRRIVPLLVESYKGGTVNS